MLNQCIYFNSLCLSRFESFRSANDTRFRVDREFLWMVQHIINIRISSGIGIKCDDSGTNNKIIIVLLVHNHKKKLTILF